MEIKYIERRSGREVVEKVPGGRMMEFIYTNPLGKLTLWMLIKRKLLSVYFGKYMSSSKSRKKIQPFIESHDIDMSEYVVPTGGFRSFNDFFFRHIKPSARPIQENIVSPADGRVLVFPSLSVAQKFFVKGAEFNLDCFLGGDERLVKKYTDGSMCIIRLAPVDYHRYHFPVSGKATSSKLINGYYYSVSPIALQKNMRIFWENKREYCEVLTEQYGDVLICDVGATLTGGISQTYTSDTVIDKGQEKGYFYFGGSTLILLFEKDRISFSQDLIENTANGIETRLKMGETIAS